MSESLHGDAPPSVASEPIPRGQRFFDNIFLLLILGLLIKIVLYTAWGMWEIVTLPQATLP